MREGDRIVVGGVRIASIVLRMVRLELVAPFRTSFGEETDKRCIVAEVRTDTGISGWAECVAFDSPLFNEEFNDGAWVVVRDLLGPALLGTPEPVAPEDISASLAWARGNRMAKSALETAVLDAALRAADMPLSRFLGAERDRVEVGVSIGIQPDATATLAAVDAYLADGYRRIKLKVEPGWDVEPVAAVRERYPDILLSVDANAAYDPAHAGVFEALDAFDLLMIEQPLHHEDLLEHARLQERLRTPLCLDESIRSVADARAALDLGACRIVNIKPGRVGGYLEARRIHDLCRERDVPVWCGGMFETGLGRAANLALAALPGFTLPGDISASSRYFIEDLTAPFEVAPDGTMAVPTGPGIGVDPLAERLEAATIDRVEIRPA